MHLFHASPFALWLLARMAVISESFGSCDGPSNVVVPVSRFAVRGTAEWMAEHGVVVRVSMAFLTLMKWMLHGLRAPTHRIDPVVANGSWVLMHRVTAAGCEAYGCIICRARTLWKRGGDCRLVCPRPWTIDVIRMLKCGLLWFVICSVVGIVPARSPGVCRRPFVWC